MSLARGEWPLRWSGSCTASRRARVFCHAAIVHRLPSLLSGSGSYLIPARLAPYVRASCDSLGVDCNAVGRRMSACIPATGHNVCVCVCVLVHSGLPPFAHTMSAHSAVV